MMHILQCVSECDEMCENACHEETIQTSNFKMCVRVCVCVLSWHAVVDQPLK